MLCNYRFYQRILCIFLEECFSGHQAVQPPSIECLTKIAKNLKFDMSDAELKEHQGSFKASRAFLNN